MKFLAAHFKTQARTFFALLLTLAILSGAFWVWAGSAGSLASTLKLVSPLLPAGQSLEFKDITGSLRHGGSVGWLRWTHGALNVEARQLNARWALRPLLDGELRISQLTLAHLRIEDRRAKTPPQPPTDGHLPLKVDATFALDTLEWLGSTPVQLTQLSGRYVFNSYSSKLDVRQGPISARYTLSASLQAQAPMALSVSLAGDVHTTLPKTNQPLTVKLSAQVNGELATRDAVLQLSAQLTPQLNPQTPAKQAMQAQASARVQPWQAQPVLEASAQWQALNLGALWPQAPQTQLNGSAKVTPSPNAPSPNAPNASNPSNPSDTDTNPSPNWLAEIQFTNALSGPWNQQRLPLDALNARGLYRQGQWTIDALQARSAGGRLDVQGQLTSAQLWAGTLSLQNLQLAALDTRLPAMPLQGQLTLQQAAQQITAQGRLQTRTAHVQGQASYHSPTQATQGQLSFSVPGASGTLAGQLASTQGGGELNLSVPDAALFNQWLQSWPGRANLLGPATVSGQASLSGQWRGGWQGPLQLKAQLRIPQLTVAPPGTDNPWQLAHAQLDLTGTLAALNVSLKAELAAGSRRLALQAQALGGQISPSTWQAQLRELQLKEIPLKEVGVKEGSAKEISMKQAAPGHAQPSTSAPAWALHSQTPIDLSLNFNPHQLQLTVGAGTAQLTGPAPGTVSLSWAPALWNPKQWHTTGSMQNLPASWLALAGQIPLASSGDLVFGGQWSASGGDTVRLRASLARTSGDLQLLTEDTPSAIQAGVREARLNLALDANALSAQINWDSERAGQAQARFSTRLNTAWQWPADAPLSGSLTAKLPPVGVWSLLAPPGWRLRGTLDTQATVSGTRSEPQWRGQLRAQDLAVRSAVDGIDFSQGQLSASLDGQRLNIDDFTLKGAGGNTGGTLTLKGHVLWLPASTPAKPLASRLRMALNATAQALRVSTRADRRLSVSGQLAAQLTEARLSVTGTLKADQALFILPEDTTPQLGGDVLLRRATAGPPSAPTKPENRGLRITPEVNITLDLGGDFAVRGYGLATRLAGQLNLRSGARNAQTPTLTGDLRTVRGTFKAYGQQLVLEEGQLRFNGPIDNPALNILAIRPNLQQRVGVQVSGTALSPVVRLYAEPDLPDAEKLAWLVLGRSASSGGAEAAVLQQAALALLGGQGKSVTGGLADALGLDELSMRGASSNADGTSAGAAVTLGKRLSNDIYVAYERSLAGTLGTFFVFYDLSRRFTLRAQTGEQSAIDLIFTLRYD